MPSLPDTLFELRQDLNRFFVEAMRRIDITNVMTHALSIVGGSLQVGNVSIPLRGKQNIVLLAVGKAAVPMATVAAAALQPALDHGQSLRGLVVGPGNPASLPEFLRHFPGAHPFPNQGSCDAAKAALELVTPLGADDLLIYLISGGASAMLEAPRADSISSGELEAFYRALVYSGLPITSMNALRKHFSSVKGGRLAVAASPAQQLSLIVSDVPGNALDVVGSGPSLPDASTVEDCRRVLADASVRALLSEPILRYFDDPALEETPKVGDAAFRGSARVCLLSNGILLEHVSQLASLAGFYTEIDVTCDDWPYDQAASYLVGKVKSLRKTHPRVCVVSGGELSVKVPEQGSGTGGRNQHFALHCALSLKESDPAMAILSAGTDGADGNSPAAGAIVDSLTAAAMARLHLSATVALESFDSYSLLHAMGRTLVTGPTGNNVRDLRVLVSSH